MSNRFGDQYGEDINPLGLTQEEEERLLIENAITTTYLFDDFKESIAHIFDDGVYRYGIKIAEKEDIEYLGVYQ